MPSRKTVERIDCQEVPPRVGNRVKLQKKSRLKNVLRQKYKKP